MIDISNRPDFQHIVDVIPQNSRVLDLGCGDGSLLAILKQNKIMGLGIEKDEAEIYKCIEKGVIVHHGDLDGGLDHHLDKSFDYVILNQSIQETRNPGNVIKESLRIGKKVIVCFPNFGHWMIRLVVLLNGRTPVTKLLPYLWFNTPNLHFLSIKDFEEYCITQNYYVEDSKFFSEKTKIKIFPNFFAKLALFIITESK
jgi:methionine biosynthesis protein MetW